MTHLAPLAAIDERSPSSHTVQFYDDEEFLCDVVTRFLGAGLATGEPVVAIATEPHLDAITERLRASAFDVERACGKGQLTLLDARELLARIMVGSMPDGERLHAIVGGEIKRRTHALGRPHARVYGEIVQLLWGEDNTQAAISVELLWNQLARKHSFSLLCSYKMDNFHQEADGVRFEDLCRAHTHVQPTERFARIHNADAQLREISMLQQRARALEGEIEHCHALERALRQALDERESANRAKDEFLAMLGHELRNPLSPIVTALQLMKIKGDVCSTKEQQVIERQVEHLVHLVDDLLDVSRITRGKVQLKKEPLNLADVVAKAVEIASPLFEERRLHFSVSLPRKGMRLEADGVRLAQVIANLLTNAAKFTEPGGTVSLSAWREGDEIVLSTKDNGIGIDAEMLPRVFELFVQGMRSADRAQGGLGIGLTLVRNLVHLHGGSVIAHSEGLGQGSEFIVRLPALAATRATEEAPGAAESAARARAGTPRRVLVVDDNVDAAELLAEILRSAGHEVTVAHDGAQALQVVDAQTPPEVALLDIGLPVMDGYELAARLRERLGQSTPRLLAVTGYGQEHDRARSAAAGFEEHFVKPVLADQLLVRIEAAR